MTTRYVPPFKTSNPCKTLHAKQKTKEIKIQTKGIRFKKPCTFHVCSLIEVLDCINRRAMYF